MLYNLADSVWVAGLGSTALAALGFISPLFFVVVGLGNGIGAGANSLIARSIGAQDKKLADNAATHTVLLTILLSILAPLILIPLLKTILLVMGAGDSVEMGLQYGNIVFGFMFVFVFSSVAAAILRSEGDVNRSMYAMAITAVLNIVLDPIFIYVLNMGMAGAAWASVLSASIACIVMGYWIWVKKNTYLTITKKVFEYKNAIVKDIALVAIPATAENLVMSFCAILINAMLTITAGTVAVAVYTSGLRINQMAMIPLIGIGTAMLTVTGAAYGARDYKKLSEAYNYSILLGGAVSIILAIIMYICAPYIAMIFTYSPQSMMLTDRIADLLKILCLFLIAMPLGIMSSCTFQGVGKGITSLVLTLFRTLIFELIFAYILGFMLNFGELGIYFGLVVGCAVGSLISFAWAKTFIHKLQKYYEKSF
jgi:putative MATE family efflux protein